MVISLDLSLSNSGIVVFTPDAKVKEILSVDTSKCKSRQEKLKKIGTELEKLNKKYKPNTIVIEEGFMRFAGATQALFEVMGVALYIFSDKEIIKYHPSTIRKIVGGKGNLKKDEIKDIILYRFPDLKFENNDQSDAYAVGLAYFYDKEILKI